jgi:hypothetical protein
MLPSRPTIKAAGFRPLIGISERPFAPLTGGLGADAGLLGQRPPLVQPQLGGQPAAVGLLLFPSGAARPPESLTARGLPRVEPQRRAAAHSVSLRRVAEKKIGDLLAM